MVLMGEIHSQNEWVESAVDRILDANLDRAREGLRVIEEWCRFGLNNGQLTDACKHLRQELAGWHSTRIRAARDTVNDPGTDLTHPNEEQRSSVTQLLQVNFARVQEAMRVLEEYGKIAQPDLSSACKQMRYRVYTLESNLLGRQRRQRLWRSHLYLVTSPNDNLLAIVEAALQGGLDIVQYREKSADDLTRLHLAEKLKQLCHRYNALFIINDRVDLAAAIDADGVHLGQQDMPIAQARQILGCHRLIGRSTTNADEMQQAIQEGADYIGVGPVYPTPTKAEKPAVGLEYVRHAAACADLPWFAIGGINIDNLNDVLAAQAERVAIVRALMEAENPTLIAQYFVSQLTRVQTVRATEALNHPSHV